MPPAQVASATKRQKAGRWVRAATARPAKATKTPAQSSRGGSRAATKYRTIPAPSATGVQRKSRRCSTSTWNARAARRRRSSTPRRIRSPALPLAAEALPCSAEPATSAIDPLQPGRMQLAAGSHRRAAGASARVVLSPQTVGIFQPPNTSSRWRAVASATSSRHGRAETCTPIGMPSGEVPTRTVAVGHPVRLCICP